MKLHFTLNYIIKRTNSFRGVMCRCILLLFFVVMTLKDVFPGMYIEISHSRYVMYVVLFAELLALTVTSATTSGFVALNKSIKIELNCGKCFNLSIKDPKNQLVQFSINGSAAVFILEISTNTTLGNYTWNYNGDEFIYSLLYRRCKLGYIISFFFNMTFELSSGSIEEKKKWRQTCQNRPKYEKCFVTLKNGM